jgi:hypothetical protein
VRSLHAGAFLAQRRNAVLVGGTGTGKTHLSIAITAQVIRAGTRARFFNAVDLVNRLEAESRNGKAGMLATQLRRLDLVVLDELGYLPFPRSGGELLFHLLARLYAQTSVIVTTTGQDSGRHRERWPQLTALPRRGSPRGCPPPKASTAGARIHKDWEHPNRPPPSPMVRPNPSPD